MNEDRKIELETFFAKVIEREIKANVRAFMDHEITAEECSQRTVNLAEIRACIATTWRALNLGKRS